MNDKMFSVGVAIAPDEGHVVLLVDEERTLHFTPVAACLLARTLLKACRHLDPDIEAKVEGTRPELLAPGPSDSVN